MLSTLAEDAVVAALVSVGTVATVTCKIIKEDTNFSISWRVDDQKVCDEDTPTDDITCSTNATHGVLQLENTTSLGVGNHKVECVLEQDIDPLFIEDPSFEDEYEAVVVRSGVLEISAILSPLSGIAICKHDYYIHTYYACNHERKVWDRYSYLQNEAIKNAKFILERPRY